MKKEVRMSNQTQQGQVSVVKNENHARIQREFLTVCNQKRLDAIVGSDNAGRFISDFITLAEQNPRADVASLAKCCVEIASLNLSINKQVGQAYVVPRGGAWNVEIGYKGWLTLAKRAGIIVRAYPIYQGDNYVFEIDGFNQVFKYSPLTANLTADKTAEFIEQNLLFIAVTTKDLSTGIESSDLVELSLLSRLRSKSTSKDSPAYRDWVLEMYKAKAIKYVLRKMPIEAMDGAIFRAFAEDDKNDVAYESIAHSHSQSQSSSQSKGLGSAFAQATPQPQVQVQIDSLFDPNTGEVMEQPNPTSTNAQKGEEEKLPVIDVNFE